MISRSSDNLIQECNVVDKGMSDHFVINCILNFIKNKPERVVIRSRNYRQIQIDTFSSEIDVALQGISKVDSVQMIRWNISISMLLSYLTATILLQFGLGK